MLRGHARGDQCVDRFKIMRKGRAQPVMGFRSEVVQAHVNHPSTAWTAVPMSNAMKELLRSNDPTIIAYAKAMLSGEDIEVFEMDVHMSVLEGSIGILPRRLMVRREDHFEATAILRANDIDLGF